MVTFLTQNGYIFLWVHLSFTCLQRKRIQKRFHFEDATKSGNLKNETSINNNLPRVNTENDF